MKKKTFRAPDGTDWAVSVVLPGSSNAMIVFRHPDGESARRDRYNWFISAGPEARSVTSRLSIDKVMEHLDDAKLAIMFRRSMPVSREPDDTSLALGLGGSAVGLSRGLGRVRGVPAGGVEDE